MRIDCIHGYFKFSETSAGQLSRFVSQYGLEIERAGDHFTFSDLLDAPDFSIPGGQFLGAPTTKAFAGQPWEVMRENRLVYNFSLGLVMPIDLITQAAAIAQAGNYFVSNGMLLPGSLTERGERVTDYAAFFIPGTQGFRYSEVEYD